MAKITQAEKPVFSIKEKEVGEALYTTLQCDHEGCTEVFNIAFSTLDAEGKPKKDTKVKIKKDFYDTIDVNQMPDKNNPGIWLCKTHSEDNGGN